MAKEKNMDRISLITCARHRPEKLHEMLESLTQTVSDHSQMEYIFGVEPDDTPVQTVIEKWRHEHPDYKVVLRIWTPDEVTFSLNQKYNMLADNASHELVSGCGDDLLWVTDKWDLRIKEEFEQYPDRILLVWINDGAGAENLPRHYTVHKNWIAVTGSYTVKFLRHYFSDNWQYDIASSIGRARYMKEIKVIHRHPVFGNAEVDDNHIKDMPLFEMDQYLYETNKGHQVYEIDKLNKFITGGS